MRPYLGTRYLAVLLAVGGLAGAVEAQAAKHLLGFGVHYWTALDDLEDVGIDLEEEGTSGLLSYQFDPVGPFKLEFDLEYFSDGFAGASGEALSPQVYVLFGKGLYAGVGVGVTYSSDLEDDFSDPYYAARLGLDFPILPRVRLDVNANYQADSFNALDQADGDSITLGATVRFRLK